MSLGPSRAPMALSKIEALMPPTGLLWPRRGLPSGVRSNRLEDGRGEDRLDVSGPLEGPDDLSKIEVLMPPTGLLLPP